MTTQKEKQLLKKIKSKKRLQRLRKQVLILRKKTIRLQQLRWLRGATVSKLPLKLNTTSALRQLYVSSGSKLSIERKFNLLLSFRRKQQALRFSRATSRLSILAKFRARVNSIRSPNNITKLTRLAQKRRRLPHYKLQLTPAPARNALQAKKSGGRRRYLRRRGYQLTHTIRSLLLRRTTRRLSYRLASAKRFIRDKGQRLYQTPTFNLNNSNFFLTTARQEAKQLTIGVPRSAPAKAVISSRKPVRRPAQQTTRGYQKALYLTKLLAKKLQALKTSTKSRRKPKFLERRAKLFKTYKQMKELLRSRFFRREALATTLVSVSSPVERTEVSSCPKYMQRYYHARVRAGLNKYKVLAQARHQQQVNGQKFGRVSRRFRSAVVLPLSWRLAAAAVKLRLQQTAQQTRAGLSTFGKQPAEALKRPRRLPRRLKRELSAALRRNQKISKGEQKRRRLGIVRAKPSKRALEPLSQEVKTAYTPDWKKPLSRSKKTELLLKLSAINTASRKLTHGGKTVIPSYTRNSLHLQSSTRKLRSTLWVLFRAAKLWKRSLAGAATQKLVTADALLQKLRRGLRRGAYNAKNLIPTCLFLLKYLPASPEQRKLFLLVQHLLVAGPATTFTAVRRKRLTAARKFRACALNRYQRELRATIAVNSTLPLALPQPTPALAPVTFERKPSKVEVTAPTVTPIATSDSVTGLTVALAAAYSALRNPAAISAREHQRKRLLPRVLRRHTRFVRFIPRRIKNRLLREVAVARNRRAAATTRFPVVRYTRQFYTKGNRIFAARYKKGFRIAAKRLVKQSRWSRATLLRLSRRRPVWRRVPQGRQTRFSTGRAITHEPYVASNKGWRARKNRIKLRTALRVRAEGFKTLVNHTATPFWAGAFNAHATLPTRVLRLAADAEQVPLTGSLLSAAPAAIPAFHAAQRQLELCRSSRATRAKSSFTRAIRRVSNGLYTRYKGRFLLEGNKKRKHPRKPRWVRLLSRATTPEANFTPLNPKLITAYSSDNTSLSVRQLRSHLWTGVGRALQVSGPNTKALPQAIANPDENRLINELRKLSLFKDLLAANKFAALARLGGLHALGRYKHLGNLSTLFVLGELPSQVKQSLLFALATDIKLCAERCVVKPNVRVQPAVTARVSSRAFFTYKEPTPTLDRDQTFFQSEAPKKKPTHAKRVRKAVLLHALTRTKNRKVVHAHTNTNTASQLFARVARTKSAVVAARLRLYRCALPSKAVTSAYSAEDPEEQLELLWARTYAEHRRTSLRSSTVRTLRNKMLQTPRNRVSHFTSLNSLPAGYKKTAISTTTPQLWINRRGRWVLSTPEGYTAPRNRAQILPKVFSTARPWGVKTVHSGCIAKEYGRFLSDARTELVSLQGYNKESPAKVKPFSPALRPLRLVAASAIYAHRVPRVVQFAPSTGGNHFWQLRLTDRDQIRTTAERRFRALAHVRRQTASPAIESAKITTTVRRTRGTQAKVQVKKTVVTPNLKLEFTSYHITGLNILVFDTSVRNNFQEFNRLSKEEQAGKQGYDLVIRAYRSALSSQERNPKLPQPQFEAQKALVGSILTGLAGVAPGDKLLEWKQLPKNKMVPRAAAPAASHKAISSPTVLAGELTEVEIGSVKEEATKKDLKSFAALSSEARRNNAAHALLRKAILRSWTKVEDANTPEESPFYPDLLLAAKAYSFYGVILDLSSRSTTTLKLAPNFTKLPK